MTWYAARVAVVALVLALLGRPIAWARYRRYLGYVLRHKWFVAVEGVKLRVSIWHLIWHDWTKFLPLEMVSYACTFRAEDGTGQYKPHADFNRAWNQHEKMHKHHWQYWVLIMDTGDVVPLEMPDRHRREMLADWRGAGMALGKPDTKAWYLANRERIKLHEETRAWVEQQLGVKNSDTPK